MAERQLYNKDFNSVAMPQGRMQEAQAVTEAVSKIGVAVIQQKEKQDQLKMTKFASEAELQLLKTTDELRIKHSGDPDSLEARQDFNKEYDKIYSQYDKEVGRFSIGKWKQFRDTAKFQYEEANVKWGLAQKALNAQTNLNSGIESSLQTAYSLGSVGDIDLALQSAELKEVQLKEAVNGILPEKKINEDMKNFRSDYMKSFVLGMAQKDPEQAMELLENDKVKKTINSTEVFDTLKKVISVEQSKTEMNLYRKQIENQANFDRQSENMNVSQQLSLLESGSRRGEYSNKWAKSKEAVILSEKKINAITQNELYADYLTRKADILSLYEDGQIDEKEYLREVDKFETEMNNDIASGKVKQSEGQKAVQALQKHLGKATTELKGQGKAFQFSEAKAYKGFAKELSGVNLNKAKRDFFYATDGKDLSVEAMKEEYTKILEGYKETSIDEIVETAKSEETKQLLEFKTVEEAEKANLATGTRIKINGRSATWQ